jgi:hypothetical protein
MALLAALSCFSIDICSCSAFILQHTNGIDDVICFFSPYHLTLSASPHRLNCPPPSSTISRRCLPAASALTSPFPFIRNINCALLMTAHPVLPLAHILVSAASYW